jgi:hypothetical protein
MSRKSISCVFLLTAFSLPWMAKSIRGTFGQLDITTGLWPTPEGSIGQVLSVVLNDLTPISLMGLYVCSCSGVSTTPACMQGRGRVVVNGILAEARRAMLYLGEHVLCSLKMASMHTGRYNIGRGSECGRPCCAHPGSMPCHTHLHPIAMPTS